MTLSGKEVALGILGRLVPRSHGMSSSSSVPPPKRIYLGLLRGDPSTPPPPRSSQRLKKWDFLPTNPMATDMRNMVSKCLLGLPWWSSGYDSLLPMQEPQGSIPGQGAKFHMLHLRPSAAKEINN